MRGKKHSHYYFPLLRSRGEILAAVRKSQANRPTASLIILLDPSPRMDLLIVYVFLLCVYNYVVSLTETVVDSRTERKRWDCRFRRRNWNSALRHDSVIPWWSFSPEETIGILIPTKPWAILLPSSWFNLIDFLQTGANKSLDYVISPSGFCLRWHWWMSFISRTASARYRLRF